MSLLRKLLLGKGDLITDAYGVQKVSLPRSLFHSTFTFDIPTSWFIYENDIQVKNDVSTVITSVNGEAKLVTTAALPSNNLESRQSPRYQPNRGHLFSTALRCPLKTANGIREWGLGTAENRIIFRLKSDGLLYAVRRSGDVELNEELIDTSKLGGFDVEKGNIYDIQFKWRGSGDYFFYIGSLTTGESKLVHTFKLLGTQNTVTLENPAMPIDFHVIRTTEDVEMFIGCADVTSENGGQLINKYTSVLSEAVVTGTDTPVSVIKVPLQIAGQTNTRTAIGVRISLINSKKATFRICTTRDPTNIIGATYKPLGEGSFLESDSTDMDPTAVRATSIILANLIFVASVTVQALVRAEVETPGNAEIVLTAVRGDFIVISCTSSGAGSADCVLELGEEV